MGENDLIGTSNSSSSSSSSSISNRKEQENREEKEEGEKEGGEMVEETHTLGREAHWVVQTERKRQVQQDKVWNSSRIISFIKSQYWIKNELVTLFKLALPIILSLVFENLILFVSLLFVGHISDRSLELDSAALSISFANITGISVGIGLSSAADTLCSQSFGYKNYKKVAHVFQRGVLILFLLALFVWIVWLNTETMLLLLQQSPCVAKFSGSYIQIFTLALPPFFVFVMLQKYLQSQSIVWPFILTGFLVNIVNVIFHAIFVIWADMGVNGASLSMVLSFYCFPLFLIIYIRWRKLHKQTWNGWSWASLKEWKQFFKLGVPGVAMTCLEWISYEIAAFVLGSISEIELAANSIMINIIILLFMLPLGISIAAGIRVGNELGAGQPKAAKRASLVASIVVFINIVIQIIFLQSIKHVYGRMYTSDEEVLEKIPPLTNILCVLIVADQLQLSLRGVVLGCGKQLIASVINFVAFYIIGLPIGISLALLTDLGSVGMWTGLTLAAYFQTFCLIVLLCCLNWEKESEKAILNSQDTQDDDGSSNIKQEEEDKIGMTEQKEERDDILLTDSSDDGIQLLQVTTTKGEDEMILEEIPLTEWSNDDHQREEEEEEKLIPNSNTDTQELLSTEHSSPTNNHNTKSSRIKLLLSKGSVYLIGIVLVIIAGVLSQFHPSGSIINGNYSECIGGDDINPFPTIDSSSSSGVWPIYSTPTLEYH